MKKLLLIGALILSPVLGYGAGEVTIINKIVPKNNAFIGVVDSSQTLVNTAPFSKNLNGTDTNVQHALQTLDQLKSGGVNLQPSTTTLSVGSISIQHSSGTVDIFPSTATNDTQRGENFVAAYYKLSVGDRLIIGPGVYLLPSGFEFVFKDSVTWEGAGMDVTILKQVDDNGYDIVPGTNTRISNLNIGIRPISDASWFTPFQPLDSKYVSIYFDHVRMWGANDVFYFNSNYGILSFENTILSGRCDGVSQYWSRMAYGGIVTTARNSEFIFDNDGTSQGRPVILGGSGEFWNCKFIRKIGDTVYGDNEALTADGVYKFHNCYFETWTETTTGNVIGINGTVASGVGSSTITLSGCEIVHNYGAAPYQSGPKRISATRVIYDSASSFSLLDSSFKSSSFLAPFSVDISTRGKVKSIEWDNGTVQVSSPPVGGAGNPFDQSLNTTDYPSFGGVNTNYYGNGNEETIIFDDGAGNTSFGDFFGYRQGTNIGVDSANNNITLGTGQNSKVFASTVEVSGTVSASTMAAGNFFGKGSGNTGVNSGTTFYLFNDGSNVNSYFTFNQTDNCFYLNGIKQLCYGSTTQPENSSGIHGNPFEFPYSGTMKHVTNQWGSKLTENPVGYSTMTILNVPTGQSGVVREIGFVWEDEDSPTRYQDVIFNVAYDGHSNPDVSIPLTNLVGWTRYEFADQTATFETQFFRVFSQEFDTAQAGMDLTYPIPYTNGIRIYLTLRKNFPTSMGGFVFGINTFYQDNLPASTWNRNLRFMVAESSAVPPVMIQGAGTMSVSSNTMTCSVSTFTSADIGTFRRVGPTYDYMISDVLSPTVAITAPNDIADIAATDWYRLFYSTAFVKTSGAGYIAATNVAMIAKSFGFFEANLRMFLNGERFPSLEWEANEDYFGGSYYFIWPNHGPHYYSSIGGAVSWSDAGPNHFSGYRLFRETPIHYTNGIKIYDPAIQDNTSYHWTIVYYEEP